MDDRKTRSERILTEDFLLTYNLIHDSSFDIVRAGDPPEPDMICRDTRSSQQLGVEVTVVYYDSTHAKSLWEPARGKTAKPYFLSRQDSECNEAFIGKIADRVKKKSRKVYSFSGKLLLIVFVEAIRFYIQDVIE